MHAEAIAGQIKRCAHSFSGHKMADSWLRVILCPRNERNSGKLGHKMGTAAPRVILWHFVIAGLTGNRKG